MLHKRYNMMIGLLSVAMMAGQGQAFASEADFPSRPIRLVVGFAPGGGTDIVARLLGSKLTEELGQPVVVENRTGASGMIGAKAVASAKPDGYTLLMGHVNSQAIAPALMERPQYDAVKDFAPVTYIGSVANVLVVPRDLPANNLTELLDLAKSTSGGLTYGSPGVGTTNHLAGETLHVESGAPFRHIPYRGSAPAMIDLLAGQIDMNFDVLPSVMPNVKAGLLKPLAVTTQQRDPDLPNVPTMAELGFKSFDINNWYGLLAPAGTSPEIVNKLYQATQNILQQPDVIAKLAELGVRSAPKAPDEFDAYIQADFARYQDIGQRLGIQLQ